MNRQQTLTPAMQSVLDRMARLDRSKRPHLHHLSPAAARLAYAATSDVLELTKQPLARVEDLRETVVSCPPVCMRQALSLMACYPA